jgi:hypothetical protein
MEQRLFDTRDAVMLASGIRLDAFGRLPGIDLPRNGIEPDHDYRNRLIEKLRKLSHIWPYSTSTETTAPPDDTKPRENHVRDAARANSSQTNLARAAA